MPVQERLLRLVRVRDVHRLARVRQPQHEHPQPHHHPGDHRLELTEVDLGLLSRPDGSAGPSPAVPARPISTFSAATRLRTLDSATTAPCSSSSRCHTRRAVCRCLRGAVQVLDQPAPDRGLVRAQHRRHPLRRLARRRHRVAPAPARTVRRCTPCLSASARIDNSSSRASRRIRSNCSTLDLSFTPHTSRGSPWQTDTESRGLVGRGWGHFKPSLRLQVGPLQAGTLIGHKNTTNRTIGWLTSIGASDTHRRARAELREQLAGLCRADLVATCARMAATGDLRDPAQAIKVALRRLARCCHHLTEEIVEANAGTQDPHHGGCAALDRASRGRDRGRRPAPHHGRRQPTTAPGQRPPSQRSAGSALCPASSGRTDRHRLNRGGDRAANSALYTVVMVRMRYDQRARIRRPTHATGAQQNRDHALPGAVARTRTAAPDPQHPSDPLRISLPIAT